MPGLILGMILICTLAFSNVNEDHALSMVPRGKILEILGRDYLVKTPAGTKIEIEFNRQGKFKEASGKNLNKGDELEPGEGLISLGSVAQLLKKQGHAPDGFWSLEHDEKFGWIYEFNAKHIVNASTGKLLSEVNR